MQLIYTDISEILLKKNKKTYIIEGNFAIDNEPYIQEFLKSDFFNDKKTLYIPFLDIKNIEKKLLEQSEEYDYCIIEGPLISLEDCKNLLKKTHHTQAHLIYFSGVSQVEGHHADYSIKTIHFREFLEKNNYNFQIADILQNSFNAGEMAAFTDEYLHRGAFPAYHIPDTTSKDIASSINQQYSSKITKISEELYPKEREEFLSFVAALASMIGELYKEDQMAKLLGISRRKIHKFLDILIKSHIVKELMAYVKDEKIEASRHNKVYFSDTSYLIGALEGAYDSAIYRLKIIENFVYGELNNKLDTTHILYFWRKKSGTEIAFILENKDTENITPIEVHILQKLSVSQAMKSFYSSYSSRIEHGMSLHENSVFATNYENKPFFMLPFWAI